MSKISEKTIKNCEFETYRLAVCCSGPDNVLVDSCTFSDGYYEHVTFDWRSRYCKAVNNRFLSGEGGIGAIGLDTAENIEILDNDFNYTNLFGILQSAKKIKINVLPTKKHPGSGMFFCLLVVFFLFLRIKIVRHGIKMIHPAYMLYQVFT